MTALPESNVVAMRQHLRWVHEIYTQNKRGIHIALAFMVCAALVEVVSIAFYYPILASFMGTEIGSGVGAELMSRVRGTLGSELSLVAMLWILVGLISVRSVCLYSARLVANHYELQFKVNLQRDFLRRFAAAAWGFVIGSKSGHLLNLFSQYSHQASRALLCLVEFLIDLVACLSYIAFAIYVSVVHAGFLLVAGLVFGPVLKGLYGRFRRLVDCKIELQNRLANKFLSYLRGFKTFKAMNLQHLYLRELDHDLETLRANERSTYSLQAALHFMGEPFFSVVGALFLMVAYYWFAISMETVVIFFALLSKLYLRVSSLQLNMARFISNLPAVRACKEFEEEAGAATERHGDALLEGRIKTIELEDVKFSYPDGTRVFENLCLKINVSGGLIVITGISGAGKSTLLDLLAGLFVPSKGTVKINGVDVTKLDVQALRSRIGFVPQSPVLLERTIRENISIQDDRETDEQKVQNAAVLADAHSFIQRLSEGYDTLMGDKGASLSLGQIQRISIARALYQGPEILFFDEPTSSLDAPSAREVLSVIERIAASYPVFLVSHSEAVQKSAGTTLHVSGGEVRLVESLRVGSKT